MAPEELLELLYIKAPIQRGTLTAVFTVCQDMVKRGDTDFSFAAVSRAGEGRGVPKAQSIRNKTGENYRALIRSFEVNSMARARAGLRRGPNDWVLEIKDARLRLLVDIHLAKLAEAERLIREFVPPGMEIRFDDRSSARSDFRLNDIERRAIEYLTSEDFLKSRDFELGKRADVLDSEGRSVFKPGTLDALNKVLKYL